MVIYVTKQQARALELFGNGMAVKDIALTLGVSYQRVVNILNEILARTPFSSKRELLANIKNIELEEKTEQ